MTTGRTHPEFSAPRPNRALMSALGVVNRWLMLRWRFRIRAFDFPQADRRRLARTVDSDTAAFLAPNHPEFGLDWMIDKEISTMVAPRMAAWAAHEIVAAAPWFWLRNNLVSHRGGVAAIDYSVSWALRGNGVLLHPEGSVRWTSDHVHALFPGVAEMALEAARRAAASGDDRPVFIAPLVWRIRYTRDVSPALHRDMRVIEHALGLPSPDGVSIAVRFRFLQESVLAARMARFGFDVASVSGLDFFARQAAFRARLVDDLLSRHRVEPAASIEHTLNRLAKVASSDADRGRIAEATRLGGFTQTVYDTPTLSQEQIAESLKRLRASLMRRGFANAVNNALPKPYGPRVAHVRVPDPIRIDVERAAGGAEVRAAYRDELLAQTRASMQRELDALGLELASSTDRFRHPNPFHRGTTASRSSAPARPGSARSAAASPR